MSRVSAETLQKLNDFIESLPSEARSKCAICNETLTHIVKTAEATIQAGTATIARVLAEKINETAAPQDRVTSGELRFKVLNNEQGRRPAVSEVKSAQCTNKRTEALARQSAERQLDINNPSAPIPEPVISWGTDDLEQIERIKEISNGHFDVDHDGTIFPIRDPELRKREHKVTMTIFPHLFDPIEGLATSPVSAAELYGMVPPYCYHHLDQIDQAIALLQEIKKLHEVTE